MLILDLVAQLRERKLGRIEIGAGLRHVADAEFLRFPLLAQRSELALQFGHLFFDFGLLLAGMLFRFFLQLAMSQL